MSLVGLVGRNSDKGDSTIPMVEVIEKIELSGVKMVSAVDVKDIINGIR